MQNLFEEKLMQGLSRWDGKKIDIFGKVYEIILEQADKGAALKYFLEYVDDINSSKDQKIEERFTQEEEKLLKNQYYQLVKRMLRALQDQNLSAECFYEKLWQVIGENVLLPSDREKIYALYVVGSDIRIPYFQMEKGLVMEDEEFGEITLQRQKEIKKALAIIRADYEQRTERSSLLIQVLEDCNEREKVVVLAHILSGVEQRAIGDIKSIIPEIMSQAEKE